MENPYQSGRQPAFPTPSGTVPPGVIQALAATKPWVRLCSILGFIGTGFLVLAGLVMMGSGAVMGMSSQNIGAQESAILAGMPVMMGIMYLLMAALYFFPALKLWKYGSAILRLISTNSMADLEEALDQQRGFWKFVGILILIWIGLVLLGILIAMFVGIAGAAAMSS